MISWLLLVILSTGISSISLLCSVVVLIRMFWTGFLVCSSGISLTSFLTTFLLLDTPFLWSSSRLLSAILSWSASLLRDTVPRPLSFSWFSVSLFDLLRLRNLLSALSLLSVLVLSSPPILCLSEDCWARPEATTATSNTTKI